VVIVRGSERDGARCGLSRYSSQVQAFSIQCQLKYIRTTTIDRCLTYSLPQISNLPSLWSRILHGVVIPISDDIMSRFPALRVLFFDVFPGLSPGVRAGLVGALAVLLALVLRIG
jgi:hypothetical protein